MVLRFVGSALEQGEAAVVIAAAKRIAALTKRLVETGYDVASTNGQGAFVTLDAERCLAKVMADITRKKHLNPKRRHRTYPRVVKRARC